MKHINKVGSGTPPPYTSLIGATVVDRNGTKASIQSIHQENEATIAIMALEDGTTLRTDLAQLERHRDEFLLPTLFSLNANRSQIDNHENTRQDSDLKIPV